MTQCAPLARVGDLGGVDFGLDAEVTGVVEAEDGAVGEGEEVGGGEGGEDDHVVVELDAVVTVGIVSLTFA